MLRSSRVEVRDGIVHVSGLFDTPQDQVATRVAAEKIPGVRGVEDTRTLSLAPRGYL
jgi:osmotically-inducible protein OsmY